MTLKQGSLLQAGKYEVRSVLGQGGFGITYLAEHTMMSKLVCIKEFFPKEYYNRDDDSQHVSLGSNGSAQLMEAYRKKFMKEARTIARLEHPNVIAIYDVFEENGTAYYVMEYIEGESLQSVIDRQGALNENIAKQLIRSVCEALRYIHGLNLLHLDIKPANIMLRKSDSRITLIDFGLAKQYDSEGNQTSSTPVGISHGFAPIEQYEADSSNSFTPATDIYALGATLYSLVTGMRPPKASYVMEEGMNGSTEHLSPEIKRTIRGAMQHTRRARPQSIDAFLRLLDTNDETIVKPTPTPSPSKPTPNAPKPAAKSGGISKGWKVAAIIFGIITFLFILLIVLGATSDEVEFDGSNGAYIDELTEYAFAEEENIGDNMYIVDAYRDGNIYSIDIVMADEDITDYSEAELKLYKTGISSPSTIDDVAKSLAGGMEEDILMKELLTHGYTIEYNYYDYDGNYMGTATITPADYSKYL
ncbi:MAG: serine/threonine protein kinase [Alistipes sp.]|nr:serine/threonine protein kinase [Alistipes sp.]